MARGKTLGIVAILIASVGIDAFFIYQFVIGNFMGSTYSGGDNSNNGDTYYCASGAEIQSAIDAIGSGSGNIVITNNISLSAQIDIDGGGTYNIQGLGIYTITPDAGIRVFFISNVGSCIIKDLIIDTSNYNAQLTTAIYITTNPVKINDVQFYGNGIYGVCLDIRSSYASVDNCYFQNVFRGINIGAGGYYCQISNNQFLNIAGIGVWLFSGGNDIVEGNTFQHIGYGIYVYTSQNTISSNSVNYFSYYGIHINGGSYNTITGNVISTDDNVNADRNVYGIFIESLSHYNIVTGNLIHYIINDYTGTNGIGMTIDSGCTYNNVIGNTLQQNEDNTINYIGADNNIIANNIEFTP